MVGAMMAEMEQAPMGESAGLVQNMVSNSAPFPSLAAQTPRVPRRLAEPHYVLPER